MAWCHMARYYKGAVGHVISRYGTVCDGFVWYGTNWVRHGMLWYGMVQYITARPSGHYLVLVVGVLAEKSLESEELKGHAAELLAHVDSCHNYPDRGRDHHQKGAGKPTTNKGMRRRLVID